MDVSVEDKGRRLRKSLNEKPERVRKIGRQRTVWKNEVMGYIENLRIEERREKL